MAKFPQSDFNAMRQDAIRRSREMQRRAAPEQKAVTPPVMADIPHTINTAPSPAVLQGLPAELQSLFHGWDGERLALLGLLYLLYKEGADGKLLLAIAYIIL